MNKPNNLAKRFTAPAKDLIRSGTGLSALIIFFTLLVLGVIFGEKFQQQSMKMVRVDPSSRQDIDAFKSTATENTSAQSEQVSPPLDTSEGNLNEPINQSYKQSNDVMTDSTVGSEQITIRASAEKENFEYPMQSSEQMMEFNNFVSEEQENSKVLEIQATELNEVFESEEELKDEEIITLVDSQLKVREEIIREEELSADDLISSNESTEMFSEPMKSGYAQALEEEKKLDQTINDYVERLSDENLSEAKKNQISIAVSKTLEGYNEKKAERRGRYITAYDELSSDEMNQSQQEKIAEMNEKEDMEYANLLRKQTMELDELVNEDLSDKNVIYDSSDNLRLQLAQSQWLGEGIEDTLKELDEDHGFFVDANDPSTKLFSSQINRSSAEEELDEKTLFLINQLSDDEEKQKLIAKNNQVISKSENLKKKKEGLYNIVSKDDQSNNSQITSIPMDYSEQIDSLELGLNQANQKIDTILEILTSKEKVMLPKKAITLEQTEEQMELESSENETLFIEDKNQGNLEDNAESVRLFNETIEETDSSEDAVKDESFYTFDQVSDENRISLDNQISSEESEFEQFTGVDEMSESMKRKTKWFISRATVKPDLLYPKEAEINNIEGDCLVKFKINQEGKTENTNANCTDKIFLNPTQQTLKQWEFEPDNYINPMVQVTYRFKD